MFRRRVKYLITAGIRTSDRRALSPVCILIALTRFLGDVPELFLKFQQWMEVIYKPHAPRTLTPGKGRSPEGSVMAHSGVIGLVPRNFVCSCYERCGIEEGVSRNPSVILCQRI